MNPRNLRKRLDQRLLDEGLIDSFERARGLILAGQVWVDGQRVDKPGTLIAPGAVVTVRSSEHPFVSRGGLKLRAALETFGILVSGKICLDVGAGTGGFTDCLLQHGAKKVVAVDVGHNQIDWRLRNDPRVEVREGVNARYLQPQDFAEKFDLAVMDVSFISPLKRKDCTATTSKANAFGKRRSARSRKAGWDREHRLSFSKIF